jgi:hypothetical protein
LARLAEATWALGSRDSAGATLRALVQADPFYAPPRDLFNPDLRAAYERLRRETAAISMRAAAETVLAPARDSLPVEIAVGRPGEVRVLLRLPVPRPRDSLLTTLYVDSVGIVKVPLVASDGRSAAGPLRHRGDGGFGPRRQRSPQLVVERLPIDTVPTCPRLPQPRSAETRKASPSGRSVLEGLGLGGLALVGPAVVSDGSLSGRAIPPGAWFIGGSIAVADIVFRRPSQPIPENIGYNASLRAQWEEWNRAIAAENAEELRLAPLRIRAAREP